VGEVDQLQDPVDERVAERDQGVDRAVSDPDQGDGEEVTGVLGQVDDQPEDDEGQQQEAEGREGVYAAQPRDQLG
jgi:hypothetical protein